MIDDEEIKEQTPAKQKRASQTIRTKDLVTEPNKFPLDLKSIFHEIEKNDTNFQFLAGFDSSTGIAYINLTTHLLLFRKTGISHDDDFETFEIVPPITSGILNIKPIFYKTFNSTLIVYFDSNRLLVSSLADQKFLTAIEICKEQLEIESVAELSQTNKVLEIILMDNIGNIQLLEIKHDLAYKMVTLERQTGPLRNLFSSVFSKSEPNNKIKSCIMSRKDKKVVHIVKFFDNKISEVVYDSNYNVETKKRSRNLHEHLRQWDLAYLNKNKLVHTDSRVVAYVPISFDKFETVFICIYNLYVMNFESTELIITKARTVKYTQNQLETLADMIVREQRGSMYDLIDIEATILGNELYIVLSFFDCEKNRHFNTVYTSDRFFRNLGHRDFDQRIFGSGAVRGNKLCNEEGFFVVLNDRFEFLEEAIQKNYLKSKLIDDSELNINFDNHKTKRINSSGTKSLIESEVNFAKRFEHLFNLYLQKSFDEEYEEDLLWVKESLTEHDYTIEIKQFMYQIAEERNRNLILAIRMIKEDLSVVEERKKELGHFDDIITIELKKKLKKLEKLDELFDVIKLEAHYNLLRTENVAIRDTIHVALAIRSHQRDNWQNKDITAFFDRIFNILVLKWRLDSTDNNDAFYTNLINIHSFFGTFNDILRSDVDQEKDVQYLNSVIGMGLGIYVDVIQKLDDNRNRNEASANGFMSILIREDNSLIAHLDQYLSLILKNLYLAAIKAHFYGKMTSLIEKTVLYVYSIRSQIYIGGVSELMDSMFDSLLAMSHDKLALDLAIR